VVRVWANLNPNSKGREREERREMEMEKMERQHKHRIGDDREVSSDSRGTGRGESTGRRLPRQKQDGRGGPSCTKGTSREGKWDQTQGRDAQP
jgi:hypothetical protein